MADKQYLNAFINNSATIRDVLATDVTDAPHKVVAYNADGKLALPAVDGDPAIGVILSDTPASDSGVTKANTEVDILIRCIGLAETEAEVKKGDFLTATAKGTVKKAATGDYILGIAMTETTTAGELVQIQITNSGYEK